jgi:mannosyltransferase
MVLAAALRVPRLWIHYWGDEAISVGIASRSLHQIPNYLRYDGSPPLYYLLLHWWIGLFGSSEAATHTLSLLISLVTVPVLWWSGRTLFSPMVGRVAALFGAVFPYLNYYGTETRMYALAGLLALVALTAFVKGLQAPVPGPRTPGIGWRTWLLVDDPARWWMALAAVASIALLYTHNWGGFLVASLAAVGLLAAYDSRQPARLRRTVAYLVVVVLAYLPWVPSLLWQIRYTGAPWAPRPAVLDFFADPVWVGVGLSFPVVIGGLLVAMMAIRRARLRGEPLDLSMAGGDGATRPAPIAEEPAAQRWRRLVRSPLATGWLAAVLVGVLGFIFGQFVHSWTPRYLGVGLVPAVVLLAATFVATPLGRRCVRWVALAMALTAVPVLINPSGAADSKSNIATVDRELGANLRPGDLVITPALSEMPAIAYYLPPGLRYATPLGVLPDPMVVNWERLPSRLSAADPTTDLAGVLRSVPVGGQLLLINTLGAGDTQTPAAYKGTVQAETVAVNVDLFQDTDFTQVRTVKPGHISDITNPVEGTLFLKTG